MANAKSKAEMGRRGSKDKVVLPKPAVEATINYKQPQVSFSSYTFGDMKSELGRTPTLREMLIDQIAGDTAAAREQIVIHKAGNFIPTMCSVMVDREAGYMVGGEPMSQKAMLQEIDKGGKPEVRPLTEDEKGTWGALDLDAPIIAEEAEPARPGDEDEDE